MTAPAPTLTCGNCGSADLQPDEGAARCGNCGAYQDDGTVECEKHGTQTIVGGYCYSGFAGGSCSADELSCGCYLVDESDDLRAAR